MGTRTRDEATLARIDGEIAGLNKVRKAVVTRMNRRENDAYADVLTVGVMLRILGDVENQNQKVYCIGWPRLNWVASYRMRPADLAINPWELTDTAGSVVESFTVATLHECLTEMLGTIVESYKGYEHDVTPDTKLWVSAYAAPGKGVVRVTETRRGFRLIVKDIR